MNFFLAKPEDNLNEPERVFKYKMLSLESMGAMAHFEACRDTGVPFKDVPIDCLIELSNSGYLYYEGELEDLLTPKEQMILKILQEKKGLLDGIFVISDIYKYVDHESKRLGKHFLTNASIRITLKRLSRLGFIRLTKVDDEQTARFLRLFPIKNRYSCCRCGVESDLHRHHYPVRNKDRGKHTIPLCSKCHRLFHEVADFGIIESY